MYGPVTDALINECDCRPQTNIVACMNVTTPDGVCWDSISSKPFHIWNAMDPRYYFYHIVNHCAGDDDFSKALRGDFWVLRGSTHLDGCPLTKIARDVKVDTSQDKAYRAIDATMQVAAYVPLLDTYNTVYQAGKAVVEVSKYGLGGLMLNDEIKAVNAAVMVLLNKYDMKNMGLSFEDTAVGMYYLMAQRTGEIGEDPLMVEEEHKSCTSVNNSDLQRFEWLTALCTFAYEKDVADMQGHMYSMGCDLLASRPRDLNNRDAKVAFHVAAHRVERLLLVIIRGTAEINDVLSDLAAKPIPFDAAQGTNCPPGGSTFAHEGMAKAAEWLRDEVLPLVRLFCAQRGDQSQQQPPPYQLVITGHSLGGGVACLLAILLEREFPTLLCYGIAAPSTVSYSLAVEAKRHTTVVVNANDVIPRASESRVIELVTELREFNTDWATYYREDKKAVKEAAAGLMAPKQRLEKSEEQVIQDLKAASLKPRNKTFRRTSSIKPITDRAREDPSLLMLPGNLVHLYAVEGVFKAGIAPEQHFGPLNRLELFMNMTAHHGCDKYLEAVRSVMHVRSMGTLPQARRWVPFHQPQTTATGQVVPGDTCPSCFSDFSWASTMASEAQRNLDRKRCYACGGIFCGACSDQKKALPHLGMPFPVRCCSACYFNSAWPGPPLPPAGPRINAL
uniref:sn-1-specific diacylglycerol lipase n=1 Tax=Octactis speculum TaxID=3111310 RepID=A0A7S2AWA4_9STRA